MKTPEEPLQINLFGKFEMRCTGKVLTCFDSSKAQELFCYLLLHPTRPYLRETLAELLWEKSSDVQTRKCLRQALWKLQVTLNHCDELKHSALLLIAPNWVQINPAVSIRLDVAEFEQHFNTVRDVAVENLDFQKIEAMQSAVALYRGDLLEGLYSDWCLMERERLRDMYLTMLNKLMAYSELSHKYETGLVYGMRILSYDQALESVHRQMMRLYYFSGDRIKALRQYERCARILYQELGVKPSSRTQVLYEQIKTDQLEMLPSDVSLPQATSLSTARDQLKDLLNDLIELERQLKHKIQLVEQAVT